MGIGDWGIGVGSNKKIFFFKFKNFFHFPIFSPFSDFSKWTEEMYEELKTNISYVVGIDARTKAAPHIGGIRFGTPST